ncbi:MAG: hypothetical protein Q7U41_00485 [Microbacterium sp.]|nr:hypothetical protein [Microbacterium sp.]
MSSLRSPVGPLSPKVYWRRRVLVLLAAAAVIAIIVLIVVRPGAGEAASPMATPTPAAPAVPAEPEKCKPRDIAVTPVTDAPSYDQRQLPGLSFTIENIGVAPCDYNAGNSQQEFLITSGDDLIWSSADCQKKPQDEVVTLHPGEPKSSAVIEWDRTRSSPETCNAERPPVIAGGATYHLTVSVGPVTSDETAPFILY